MIKTIQQAAHRLWYSAGIWGRIVQGLIFESGTSGVNSLGEMSDGAVLGWIFWGLIFHEGNIRQECPGSTSRLGVGVTMLNYKSTYNGYHFGHLVNIQTHTQTGSDLLYHKLSHLS